MGLKELKNLKVTYDSERDDIITDFYTPVLSKSKTYYRLAGFFSSTALAVAARGIQGLIKNGGKMKLVVGAKLNESDIEAIRNPRDISGKLSEKLKLENIDFIENEFVKDHVRALGWMVANNLLEIKVAVLIDEEGIPLLERESDGYFHMKIGIFKDENGDKISFAGSVNESRTGWKESIENFDVNISWNERDNQKIVSHSRLFKRYWEGLSNAIYTCDIPKAMKKGLIHIAPDDIDELNLDKYSTKKSALIANKKWRHQDEAIEEFFDKKHGILEMATGTGKTRTSLRISEKLMKKGKISGIVVATFGNDLLDQWYNSFLKHFKSDSFLIYRGYGPYKELNTFLRKINYHPSALLISYDKLSEVIDADYNGYLSNCLIICDEVHNIGSDKRVDSLRGKLKIFPWRLGLSATPEREFDEKGNKFIIEEIGPVIYRFTPEEAIRRGVLCEFDYIPLFYHLSEKDKERKRAAFARYNNRKKEDPSIAKVELYIGLAKIRKVSKAKIPIFKNYLKNDKEILKNSIIFTETKEYGYLLQRIIHQYIRSYHTYYGEDQKENLQRFAEGEISTLITCKAISEGIDIKSVKNIILFSSDRSKLQTMQRIGRALRIDPSNPSKRAKIIDFVVKEDLEDKGEKDWTPTDKERYELLMQLSKVKRED